MLHSGSHEKHACGFANNQAKTQLWLETRAWLRVTDKNEVTVTIMVILGLAF